MEEGLLQKKRCMNLERIGSALSGFCFVGVPPYDKAISAHLRKKQKEKIYTQKASNFRMPYLLVTTAVTVE